MQKNVVRIIDITYLFKSEQKIWSYLSGLFGIGGELDMGCATILCTLVGRRLLVLLRMLEKRPLPLVGLQQNKYKDQKAYTLCLKIAKLLCMQCVKTFSLTCQSSVSSASDTEKKK